MNDFRERTDKATQWLLSRKLWSSYFMVSRLGYPVMSNDLETASVSTIKNNNSENKSKSSLNKDNTEKIRFEFNPQFFNSLHINELIGVMVHESLHVLFNHLTNNYGNTHRYYWNLACDAVINDLIEDSYKDKNIKLPGKYITGMNLIGENCCKKTAEEVYDHLMKYGIKFGSGGNDELIDTIDDHRGWTKSLQDLTEEELKSLKIDLTKILDDAFQNDDGIFGIKGIGSTSAGNQRKVVLKKPSINPYSLIRKLLSHHGKPTPVWVPYNSKLGSIYPSIVLPSWDVIHKPKVLFAIDTSGSISRKWLNMFASIVYSTKNIVTAETISFDTEVFPYKVGNNIKGGGGTEPQAIENYILSKGYYPENVVVLTDGWFYTPKVKWPKRWLFLIQRDEYYLEGSNNIPIGSQIVYIPK